jgi:hypothetical protein
MHESTGFQKLSKIIVEISVPYKGVGCCLKPEGNGANPGEGGKGGPAPQTSSEIGSLTPARKEQHGAGGRRKEEPGVTRKGPACTK